jgi:hypothetical protein
VRHFQPGEQAAEEGLATFALLCAQVLDHARLVFQVRLDRPIDDPASPCGQPDV